MTLWELDTFKPNQFLGFVRTVPPPNTFMGTRWLPDLTTFDISFEYVLGGNRRPVMAHVMGFDSEAPIHGRPGAAAKVVGELPPIKRKARIGEKTIIRHLQPRANTPDQQIAVDEVLNLTVDLLDAVQARVEWLRMQALSEDTVVYNDAGVQFTFDFGLTDNLQIDLVTQTDGDGSALGAEFGDPWDQTTTANPVLDLQAINARSVAINGVKFAEFVLSDKGWNYLYTNSAMKNMIRGSAAPDVILTQQEIQTLFTLYGLPVPITYDVFVQQEQADGTYVDVRTMAENKSFLVPQGGGIGNTLWGPTAESRILVGTALAGQAPGIWASTYNEDEPPTEWTKAAAVAFPTMPRANALGQMKLF